MEYSNMHDQKVRKKMTVSSQSVCSCLILQLDPFLIDLSVSFTSQYLEATWNTTIALKPVLPLMKLFLNSQSTDLVFTPIAIWHSHPLWQLIPDCFYIDKQRLLNLHALHQKVTCVCFSFHMPILRHYPIVSDLYISFDLIKFVFHHHEALSCTMAGLTVW